MPASDIISLIGAVAAASVAVLGAIGALYVKMHGVERTVNGRMTELLALTRSSAKAEGALGAAPSLGATPTAAAVGTEQPLR